MKSKKIVIAVLLILLVSLFQGCSGSDDSKSESKKQVEKESDEATGEGSDEESDAEGGKESDEATGEGSDEESDAEGGKESDSGKKEAPYEMSVYSKKDMRYTFLYPKYRPTEYNEEDGACVYGENGYVLVYRSNESFYVPEVYFGRCKDALELSYDMVDSGEIMTTDIDGRTLYRVRYKCEKDSKKRIIDRYVEFMDDGDIQYTAVSDEEDAMNTELYYAIKTMLPVQNGYMDSFDGSCKLQKNDDVEMQIEIPESLNTRELTLGYYATNEDAILLSVFYDTDDDGKPIYNRKDFSDKAAADPDFLANQLGADAVTCGEGMEQHYNGRSFYCYPADLTLGSETFSGKLCLASSDNNGCYMICYAVDEGCPAYEDWLELLDACVSTFKCTK